MCYSQAIRLPALLFRKQELEPSVNTSLHQRVLTRNYCDEKASVTGNQALLAVGKPKQGLQTAREGFPQLLCCKHLLEALNSAFAFYSLNDVFLFSLIFLYHGHQLVKHADMKSDQPGFFFFLSLNLFNSYLLPH